MAVGDDRDHTDHTTHGYAATILDPVDFCTGVHLSVSAVSDDLVDCPDDERGVVEIYLV